MVAAGSPAAPLSPPFTSANLGDPDRDRANRKMRRRASELAFSTFLALPTRTVGHVIP